MLRTQNDIYVAVAVAVLEGRTTQCSIHEHSAPDLSNTCCVIWTRQTRHQISRPSPRNAPHPGQMMCYWMLHHPEPTVINNGLGEHCVILRRGWFNFHIHMWYSQVFEAWYWILTMVASNRRRVTIMRICTFRLLCGVIEARRLSRHCSHAYDFGGYWLKNLGK